MSEYAQEPAEEYGSQLEIQDHRQPQFLWIDFKVFDYCITANNYRAAYIVYSALVRFVNKDRVAWPTWETLMRVTRYGKDTLHQALQQLRRAGLIEIEQMRKGGKFGANRYVLLDLQDWQPQNGQPLPQGIFTDSDSTVSDFSVSDKPGNKLDPVLSRSRSYLDPEDTHKTRARENADCPSTEDEDRVGYGEESGEMRCIVCGAAWDTTSPALHRSGCTYYDPMDDLQPVATPSAASGTGGAPAEACRAYQPGFACGCLQRVVAAVAEQWWGTYYQPDHVRPLLREFRNTEELWTIAHEYSVDDIVYAAAYWKQSGEKLRLPLFFSQIASTLATAQSHDNGAARPRTIEEQQAYEKTKRMVARWEAEHANDPPEPQAPSIHELLAREKAQKEQRHV